MPNMHKAEASDPRLTESSCKICGDTVKATVGANGKMFVHADGHVISSRPEVK